MKKFFTLCAAFAMAATFSANAENVSKPALNNAADPYVVGSKNLTVKINFTEPVSFETVEIMGGAGSMWMRPSFTELEVNKTDVDSFTLTIQDEWWGEPFGGYYNLAIIFPYVTDEDGEEVFFPDFVDGEEGDIYMPLEVYFKTKDTAPATFLGVYPSPEDVEDAEMSLDDLYESGILEFTFSNLATITDDAIAQVRIASAEGDNVTFTVSNEELMDYNEEPNWNRMGQFVVAVPIYSDMVDFTDINLIMVSLTGIETEDGDSLGRLVGQYSSNTRRMTPKNNNQGDSKLSLVNDSSVAVYTIQGTLINDKMNPSQVSELPAGLYIVDGKKVIVK